ncbi:PRC-barrel domain containing protein [Citricoccus sp. SGAir0253]|uniref:PRC-barrel domain-containing protein n=1 Tax=Citricoccus sp. SGAir0253 TaxID=2567881 RepID=UPI0010CCC330|nr:PRC-barrel domain-containing protein [Citricoccus sp. SGAir0253]QCU78230.1 PRC-barrel domain containing protein [Citricoccus sp. SGAir0253]
MAATFPAPGRDPDATVYDIRGNPIGTVADIYLDAPSGTASEEQAEPDGARWPGSVS